MANINMTYQELESQASQFDSRRQEMEGILTQLMNQVNSLTGSGFVTDQASGAFNESYSQFTTGTKAAVDGLIGMSQFLRNAAQMMSDLDAQLAAGIRG